MNSFIDKSEEDLKEELNKEIRSDNTQKVKKILDYATENKIILELNEKDEYGDYLKYTPIFEAIQNNNIEMFKMLVKYSIEKGIKLIIDENDIAEMISEEYYLCELNNISEINSKFIELIYFCNNKNIIEVIFSVNSYFWKKFREFNENKGIENEQNRIGRRKKRKRKNKKRLEITENRIGRRKKGEKKIRKHLKLLRIEKEKKENKKLEKKNYKTLLTSVFKQKLINYGMDINKKNKGDTSLLNACKNRNIELAKYLLNLQYAGINPLQTYICTTEKHDHSVDDDLFNLGLGCQLGLLFSGKVEWNSGLLNPGFKR
ncbi:hypothetical protein U3516DRAFT_759029 [Neocallimastix sp. 'constans']